MVFVRLTGFLWVFFFGERGGNVGGCWGGAVDTFFFFGEWLVFLAFLGLFGGSSFAEWREGLLSGGVLLLRNCFITNG